MCGGPAMNLVGLSDGELESSLVTLDYQGREYKKVCLEESVRRKIKVNNHGLIEQVSTLRGKLRAANENVGLAGMTENFAIKQREEMKIELDELKRKLKIVKENC